METILTHHPKQYSEQGFTQCGAFSVKAILSTYGKDDKRHPRDYNPTVLGKYTSLVGTYTWPKVLESYELHVDIGNTKNLSDEQRVEILKEAINKDNAIMIRIGNGYLKSRKYFPLAAYFIGHWITLWGYNDEKQIFYVYDSCVSPKKYDTNIPVGNTTRTFAEILGDWGKGFPPARHYRFIKVNL